MLDACAQLAVAQNALQAELAGRDVYGFFCSVNVRASCAIVAEMVGGTVHAQDCGSRAPVLTTSGRTIAVWTIHDEFRSSWFTLTSTACDEVAIVVWVAGAPAAVHFIAMSELAPMLSALAVNREPFGASVDYFLHANLMMEPLLAELYGVKTVLLAD